MGEQAANVLQKASRTLAQDHFYKLQQSLAPLKRKRKEGWLEKFAQYR